MKNEKHIFLFNPHVSEKAIENVVKTLHSKWIGQGPKVSEFEENFKQIIGVAYAIAVNGVASAIRLALSIAGVRPGDEVITTPQTCTATNHPILEQFAVPIFADIQYLTGNIEPGDIEQRITEKTKAIICVDLGGNPCDLDEIHSIARHYDLPVIEDAQDALGAIYKGKPIGTISPYTCFSFGAVQQVTTGEGGMLTVLDKDNYEAAGRRRWFGIDRVRRKPNIVGYYDFDVWETGYSYHMTDIAAAMGLAHINELNTIIRKRKNIAIKYRKELGKIPGIILFEDKSDRSSAYQLFTIHVEKRDDFCKMIRSKNIDVSIVHDRNDRYSVFGGLREDLPVLNRYSETNISIPIHHNLSEEDISYVIKSIKEGW